jgi:hypothetical protein
MFLRNRSGLFRPDHTVLHMVSRIAICAGLCFLPGAATWASDGDNFRGEIAGLGGMQHLPGVTKAMVGGEIGRTISTHSLLFAETSYVPLGFGDKLVNFTGGVNIGFATSMDKLVPYLSVVGGLGRSSGNGSSENDATFGIGFGTRYFVGRNWGVRPVFRWQRYQQSAGGVNTYVFTAGLFYRFGDR